MPVTGAPLPEQGDDAAVQARARALASPLRLRILRLCLHESRTNKELAEELGVNAGSLLHHVRSLVANGFLVAEPPRRGNRGAREVPYRATGLSWRTPSPGIGQLLLDTFLMEIEGMDPADLNMSRLGLKLNAENRERFLEEIQNVLNRWAERDSDADGSPISIFFAEHPDLPRRERGLG